MSESRPTVAGVLAQTIAIAPLNILPLAAVALLCQLPFIVFPWTVAYRSLLLLTGAETYLCLNFAMSWVFSTFTFHGAIEAAHGRRVGFRDCLVQGAFLALPIAPPVFVLGFVVGTAFQLHPLAGLATFLVFALMPFTWAVERRTPFRALRRGLDDAIRYPWLIAPTIFTIAAVELCDEIFWRSYGDVYARWLGRIWHDISLLVLLFVSVLLSCACAALYNAIRRDSGRL
jgi:hypothetical protein